MVKHIILWQLKEDIEDKESVKKGIKEKMCIRDSLANALENEKNEKYDYDKIKIVAADETDTMYTVSYTHLDVYKRQVLSSLYLRGNK